MKIEKLYESLNAYVSTLEESEADVIKKLAADPAAPVLGDSFSILASILRDIRAEIATAEAKSMGHRGILAAARRLIRVVVKSGREAFAGAWTGKDGRQYICSGYHGVALNEPLDLPEIEARPALEDIILGDTRQETAVLPLPTLSKVKAHVKICKAEKRTEGPEKVVFWDFGSDRPLVNAQYLADMLEILPDAEACYQTKTADKGPIYFHSPGGDGILLPVNPGDRQREDTVNRYAPPNT